MRQHQPALRAALRTMRQPDQLIAGIAAGSVASVINGTLIIAYAILIFSGLPASYRPDAIGMLLMGSLVLSVIGAIFSSFRGAILVPQDAPAAIMGLVAVAIIDDMPHASASEQYLTIIAALGLTSIGTGVVFTLLGVFKQGEIVRVLPYPVMGGFLAGTGLLLVQGAISISANVAVRFGEWEAFQDVDRVLLWLPALALGVLLLVLVRRFSHPLLIPGLLAASAIVLYLVLLVTGTSIDQAAADGWLLDPLPDGGHGNTLWQPVTPDDLRSVDWSALVTQIGQMSAVVFVSVIGLLLNSTGIELATEQDANLSGELTQTGAANILSGLVGGLAGYVVLSDTALAHKMGSRTRLPGLIVGLSCLVLMIVGSDLLRYIPNLLLGGLVFLVGLDFLVTWLYDYWTRLTWAEYAIVILIMVVINVAGFLEGIGVGIIISALLFIVNYSRVNVVQQTLDGTTFHSNVIHAPEIQHILTANGGRIAILRLQGYIFFGTANRLLERVRQRVEDTRQTRPSFLLLDFRRVTGLDSSAILSFAKMKQIARAHGLTLIFAALPESMKSRFVQNFPPGRKNAPWQYVPDLDHGMEWCENQLLTAYTPPALRLSAPLEKRLAEILGSKPDASIMMGYLERSAVRPGTVLVQQNTPPHSMIFIESGRINIQLEREAQPPLRIRTMHGGTIVGELSVYLNQLTTASVVADADSTVYYLTVDALHRLESEHPDIASAFHLYMARFLAERVTQTTHALAALVD